MKIYFINEKFVCEAVHKLLHLETGYIKSSLVPGPPHF